MALADKWTYIGSASLTKIMILGKIKKTEETI